MQDCWPPTKVSRKPFHPAVLQACVGAVICACLLFPYVLADAAESRCPGQNVVVHWDDSGDMDVVCDAASDAIGFLAGNGFDTSKTIDVHLVDKLPREASASSYGCYDHPHRRVYMLNYSDCLERGPWADMPMDRELYKSLLAHEVAHAVAATNFSTPKPGVLAHEYVAYVTMFAIMAPDQRQRLLKQFPGRGFDSVNQMSTTYYLMNPLRFGVESYRHFLKQDDGKALFEGILTGQVRIGNGGR